jgi:uncharacterized protein (TIGR00730 family)
MRRLCVFAGSSNGAKLSYVEAARDLGHTLARRHVGLVYGGARVGLMGVVADAVLARGGEVTGVIPRRLAAKEIAHEGLTDLRVVESMHERKMAMADLADGFVALPGGLGTCEEFFEVWTWAQLGLHRKPCGLLNVDGYWDPLLTFIEHSIEERFVKREYRRMLFVSALPDALLESFEGYVPPAVEKWIGREES